MARYVGSSLAVAAVAAIYNATTDTIPLEPVAPAPAPRTGAAYVA
jgi:hypothetical protein